MYWVYFTPLMQRAEAAALRSDCPGQIFESHKVSLKFAKEPVRTGPLDYMDDQETHCLDATPSCFRRGRLMRMGVI